MAKRGSKYRVVHRLAVFALLSFVACQVLACLLPASVEARKQSAHCPSEAAPETSSNACQQNLATEPSTTLSAATAIKMAMPDIADRHLPWHTPLAFNPLFKSFPVSNEWATSRSADLYLLTHSLRI